ncbi:MAG: TetR/AcrR family transcriptional regulator C-terminal domain-containing protein [Clostridia bacterium]|nr:TetR/AcrR family transcriptional regulator C-terminal domain-containing protein [Clostridia bacterium]
MNTVNNKRRKASKEKIEKVFVELLQTAEINEITVSDICKRTNLNRSTFYANYEDIYALADTIRERLEAEVNTLYDNDMFNNCSVDYLKLFQHIKENPLFYKTYFKLGYDKQNFNLAMIDQSNLPFSEKYMEYHIEFHKAGLNAIIKKWLDGGLKESPEEIYQIIKNEYNGRKK